MVDWNQPEQIPNFTFEEARQIPSCRQRWKPSILCVSGHHDKRVGVVQFIKGKWHTGEKDAFAAFGDRVVWHAMGEGFTWESQDLKRDIAAAEAAWAKALELMSDPSISLVVLDELNIALRYDYLDLEKVVAALKARREGLHVVITGRNAKPLLVEAADLVTEMGLTKHHFSAGVKAQQGIEF